MKRLATLVVVVAAATGSAAERSSNSANRNAFLHWDIDSSLDLPGGPTPEQVEDGMATYRSKEEMKVLKDTEDANYNLFKKVNALHVVGARGGETPRYAEVGFTLSLCQARLAWANGKASATVARLEQAVTFANLWVKNTSSAYATDGMDVFGEYMHAIDARSKAQESLIRVRNALQELGLGLIWCDRLELGLTLMIISGSVFAGLLLVFVFTADFY